MTIDLTYKILNNDAMRNDVLNDQLAITAGNYNITVAQAQTLRNNAVLIRAALCVDATATLEQWGRV